ncbi:MAG: hypothetical protein VYB51_06680, partial [Gemmatimonadota bacterium]|nr:hypothetical protein [Gemmatimonadota bacterium]
MDDHGVNVAEVVGIASGFVGEEPVADHRGDGLCKRDPDVWFMFVLEAPIRLSTSEEFGQAEVASEDRDQVAGVGGLKVPALGASRLVDDFDLCS